MWLAVRDAIIKALKNTVVQAALARLIIPFIKWVGVPVFAGSIKWVGLTLVKMGFDNYFEPIVKALWRKGYRMVLIKKGENYDMRMDKARKEGDINDLIGAYLDSFD